jgi:hypothetical protein
MTDETMSLFLGSAVGSITKLIGKLVSASLDLNKANLEATIQKQDSADTSADKAAQRSGGVWVRRIIVVSCLFAVVVVPLIMAFQEQGVTVSETKNFLFFSWQEWKTLGGFVILPEIRQTLLAIVGFYFGASQIK